MERRYDILFSITVQQQNSATATRVVMKSMRLTPTQECQEHLGRHNMLFKSVPGGGLIIIEKNVPKSGMPQPTRPLQTAVDFSFLLENTDTELLNLIEPYATTKFESVISGRNRFVCYFDNLNNALAADTTTELSANGTAGGPDDIFFIYPKVLTVPVSNASRIKTNFINPGGTVKEFSPDPAGASFIEAEFLPGAYLVEQIGGVPTAPERALINESVQQARALGMVRIFKDNTVNYNQSVPYTITFKKVP